jgi:hypothetical protein
LAAGVACLDHLLSKAGGPEFKTHTTKKEKKARKPDIIFCILTLYKSMKLSGSFFITGFFHNKSP